MLWFLAASPVQFPGGDVLIALLIGTVIGIPHLIAYAMLSASMPRSGGDYVFQSRILHPSLGFMIAMSAWVIWLFNWNAWGCIGSISVTFHPVLALLGTTTGNPAFLSAATWVQTTTGTVVISVMITVIGYLIMLGGMRTLAKYNLFVLAGLLVGWLMLLAFTIPNSPQTFAPAFNRYLAQTGANDTYQSMIESAKTAGFNVSPQFSWTNTLGIVPLTYSVFVWFFWSTYNSGELKRGSELKTHLVGMLGAMAFMFFICFSIIYFYLQMIGYQFWNALSYAYIQGTPTATLFPALPSYTLLPLILTNSPYVVILFYVAIGVQYPTMIALNTIPASRIMFAMSFDRVLPSKIGDVSDRFHIPHWTYLIGFIASIAWLFLLMYTQVGSLLYSMTSVSTIAIMVTCLAAAAFPYVARTKNIYETSPFAKMKVIGIPAITAAGILGFLLNGWMLYYFAVNPVYGAWTWPVGVGVNVGIFLLCLVWYYAAKYYRKTQGIDLGMVFKEIPPE